MCEDYPCCGHTDGLGCDWNSDSVYSDEHLLCNHETGLCDVERDDDDDDGVCWDCGEFSDECCCVAEHDDETDSDWLNEDGWLDASYEY